MRVSLSSRSPAGQAPSKSRKRRFGRLFRLFRRSGRTSVETPAFNPFMPLGPDGAMTLPSMPRRAVPAGAGAAVATARPARRWHRPIRCCGSMRRFRPIPSCPFPAGRQRSGVDPASGKVDPERTFAFARRRIAILTGSRSILPPPPFLIWSICRRQRRLRCSVANRPIGGSRISRMDCAPDW